MATRRILGGYQAGPGRIIHDDVSCSVIKYYDISYLRKEGRKSRHTVCSQEEDRSSHCFHGSYTSQSSHRSYPGTGSSTVSSWLSKAGP